MWFRNLRLYRLTGSFGWSPEELEERLAARAFRPCASTEPAATGWVPALGGESAALVHGAGARLLICARTQERVLPGPVVREALDERVAFLEAERGRRLRRKERAELREELVLDLLPRAFTRSRLCRAYVSPADGWLVVDAASARYAEQLTGLLRETLGALPLAPPAVRDSPRAVMTGWLGGQGLAPELALGEECELREPGEDGGVARFRRQDLTGEEIGAHLQAGKQVTRLALEWDTRLSGILGEDLSFKRLRFDDLVQEEAARAEGEDEASRLDAEFALMSLELARFLPRLLELFGGEDREAYAAAGEAA